MRVLHITRDFPPRSHGGLSTAVGGTVAASAAAGIATAVVSFDDWRAADSTPAAAPPGASGGLAAAGADRCLRVSRPAQLDAVRALARNFQPSLLHLHDCAFWTTADELRRDLGCPLVVTLHLLHAAIAHLRGSDEPTWGRRGEEAAITGADLLLAPSAAVAQVIAAADVDAGRRVRVVGHGVADSAAALAAVERRRVEPIALYVGRFSDIKGTGDLLAALPAVLERVPAARFVFAGGVPGNRRSEARWRRRHFDGMVPALRDRLTLRGWLDAVDLAGDYAAARVVVVPSRYETFGLVALEAMLHGAPVVAADAGGLGELVRHEHTGLMFPPGDITALQGAVTRLLEDAALARRLGRAAAAEVRRARLWEYVMPKLLAAYSAVGARIAG